MGADDRNEGHAWGECVEHVWRIDGLTLAVDGAHIDSVCTRCDAVMLVGPDELSGRTG